MGDICINNGKHAVYGWLNDILRPPGGQCDSLLGSYLPLYVNLLLEDLPHQHFHNRPRAQTQSRQKDQLTFGVFCRRRRLKGERAVTRRLVID